MLHNRRTKAERHLKIESKRIQYIKFKINIELRFVACFNLR
jgi:hypothetical protein